MTTFFVQRREAYREHVAKFGEVCIERCLEIVKQRELLDEFNDRLHIFILHGNVKINVSYTSYEGKYSYAVYTYDYFLLDYHRSKMLKKSTKVRYFFDMRSAILYAKHLQGEKLCWSISKNPFKRMMFTFKNLINNSEFLVKCRNILPF